MKSPEELRAILDAMPRPIEMSATVQIVSLDPETGKERTGMNACYLTSMYPEEALFMLQYMQEEKNR